MSDEVQGREETKLANGGGAFPFWVSVVIVVGFVAIEESSPSPPPAGGGS